MTFKVAVKGGPFDGAVIKADTLKFSVTQIRPYHCPRTGILLHYTQHKWRGRYSDGMWIGELHAKKRLPLDYKQQETLP